MARCYPVRFIMQALALACGLAGRLAFSDTHTWVGSSGNWSDDACWSLPGPLATTDGASLTFTDAMPRTVILDATTTVQSVILNAAGPDLLNFSQSANTFTSNTKTLASSGQATYLQAGGTNVCSYSLKLGYDTTGVGNYTLSNGLLAVNGGESGMEYVGYSGVGNFIQSGGTHSFGGKYLYLGYNAGSTGSYTLSGTGVLKTGILATGVLSIIGYSGTGNFYQSGGTHVPMYLYLGNNAGATGTYSLSGTGVLSGGFEVYGGSGKGYFYQTGGTHTTSLIDLGYFKNSVANYDLSSGQFTVSYQERIGISGWGSMTQSGGTHNITGTIGLAMGSLSGGSGSYALSGAGVFNAPMVYLGGDASASGGTGTFAMTGGTAAITGMLQIWNNGSRFDLAGGTFSAATLNVTGGTLAQSGGLFSVSTVSQSSGSIALGGTQTLYSFKSVTCSGGSTTLAPGGNRILKTEALSLSGTAKLDLADNDLVLQTTSPDYFYTYLKNWIISGRNQGRWNGSTGLTSSLATNTVYELNGLALAKASDLGLSMFDGQQVNGNSLLVKYTYAGDANLDGQITMDDYLAIDAGYLFGGTKYTQGDFNYDGRITAADYVLIDYAYLHQSQALGEGIGWDMIALHAGWFGAEYGEAMGWVVDVPEAGTAGVILVGGMLMMGQVKGRRGVGVRGKS